MDELLALPGTEVLYRCWPSAAPRAVLLLVHGLGAHAGRWRYLGPYFSSRQITVYALELRGFGASPGPRGHVDSFRLYAQDLSALLKAARREHPATPVFLYGESMGGLIALNFATEFPEGLAGLMLGSPVFKSILRFPLATYVKTFASLPVNPCQPISLPFTSAMCTRDPAVQSAMDQDPLELRVASAKLLVLILIEQLRAMANSRRQKLPALVLTAGQDQFGDNRSTRRVFEQMPAKDKTYLLYADMRHVLHVEQERDQVFQDILGWMEKRLSLP